MLKAAMTLDGPGIGKIGTCAAINGLTSAKPGSEINGVPASLTSATMPPSSISLRIRAISGLICFAGL